MTQSTKLYHSLLWFIVFRVEIALSKQYQPSGDSNYLELDSPHINVKYINIDLDQLDMRSSGPDRENENSKDTNNVKYNKSNYKYYKIITTKKLGHEKFQPKHSDHVKMRLKENGNENEKFMNNKYKYKKSYYKMQNAFKTKEMDRNNFKSNNGSDYEDMTTYGKAEKSKAKNHKRIKTRELHDDNLNLDQSDNENTAASNVTEQNKSYADKIYEETNYTNYMKRKKYVTKKEPDYIKYFKSNTSDYENIRSNNSECKQETLKGKNFVNITPKKRKHKKICTTEQACENTTLNHDNTRSNNSDSWNVRSKDTYYKIKSNQKKHKRIKTKEQDQEHMKLQRLDQDETRLGSSNSENEISKDTNNKSETTNKPDIINLTSNTSDNKSMKTDNKTETSENSNYVHFKQNLLDQVVVTKEPDLVTSQTWLGIGKSKSDSQEAIARLNFIRQFLNETPESEEKKETLLVNDVFFAVRTTQLYHETRLPIILQTWFPMAKDMTYFFTDFNDDLEGARLVENHMVTTNCNKTYSQESLCCKMESAFTFFYDFYKDVNDKQQPRWFCHFDDDTYVNIDTLLRKLAEFDAQENWYIGRQYTENFDPNGKYLIFAERGAGICLTRTLLLELQPHIRNRQFFETCEKHDIRDDEALGYIIREKANGTLTNVPEFQGDIGDLARIPTELLRRQITVGYRLERKVVKVLGFSVQEDPTRLLSLHCYLYPEARYCVDYKDSHTARKRPPEPIRDFKFEDDDSKENYKLVINKDDRIKRKRKEPSFWETVRSFFLNLLPKSNDEYS